jgi:protein SCO1/2
MKRALLLTLAIAAPAAGQSFDPFHEARIENRLGAQVPLDVPLADASGAPTTLRALAGGRTILLVPVLHHCPNLGGVTLAGVAEAVAAVPDRDFVTIAFGIDPREGPDAARDDLAQLHGKGGFRATTGTDSAIRAVTDAIGYHYAWDPRIRQYAHAAGAAVIDRDGRLSGWLFGVTPQPAALHAALLRARTAAPASWVEPLLLLCFHYDPGTGRYTFAIERVLQLAGLVTVLAIGAMIFRLRRKRA